MHKKEVAKRMKQMVWSKMSSTQKKHWLKVDKSVAKPKKEKAELMEGNSRYSQGNSAGDDNYEIKPSSGKGTHKHPYRFD